MNYNRFFIFLAKASQVLLLFLGVYSCLMCATVRLNILLDKGMVFGFLFLFAAALWWLFYLMREVPRGHWIAVCIGIFLPVIFSLRFGTVLLKGMAYVVNSILKLSMIYYNIKFELLTYPSNTEQYTNAYSATIFTIGLGFLILLVLSMTFYKKRSIVYYMLLTFPFFVFPYFVGYVGFYTETIIYLTTLAAVLATGQGKHNYMSQRLRDRISLYAAGIVLLCTILGFFIYTPDKFEKNIESHKEIKRDFTALSLLSGEDLMEWMKANFSASAIDYGSVGNKDQVVYNGTKLLEIRPTLITDSSLYLKGFVGDKYKDGHWYSNNREESYRKDLEALRKTIGGSPEIWPKTLEDDLAIPPENAVRSDTGWLLSAESWFLKGSLSIKNIALGRGKTVIPYYLMEDVTYDEDGNVQYKGGIQYTTEYYCRLIDRFHRYYAEQRSFELLNEKENDISQRILNTQKSILDFVSKYYLDIPDTIEKDTFSDFDTWCKNHFVDEKSHARIKVKAVQSYLTSSGKFDYTLAPGKTPDGKDSIDYFINEHKKGYCVHFASAAVLLLRHLGVPARFVEGVFIENERLVRYVNKKESYVAVLDQDAHAWVEVYMKDTGFMPIDFTPGRADDSDDNLGPVEPQSSIPPKTPPTPSPKPAGAATPTPDPLSQPSDDYEDMEFDDIDTTDSAEDRDKGLFVKPFTRLWFWMILILIVIGIPVCIQGQWILRQRIYFRSLHKKKPRARISAMYFHIRPLLSDCGIEYNGEPLDEYTKKICSRLSLTEDQVKPFTSSLMKSQFAKEITGEELAEFKAAYRIVRRRMIRNASLLKRILYRYIFNQ